MSLRKVVVALTLFLACSAHLSGQGAPSAITGVVTDSAGAVIPHVAVTALNVETNIARSVQTSGSGDYTMTNLPLGRYELKAEMRGFRTHVTTGIVLEVGQTLRANIQLEIGAVADSVTVAAEVAALNTDVGAIKGDVIVQQELRDLPLEGRDFTDLAFLVPGVMPKAEGGQGGPLNVNGARADGTSYYVDGFSSRDARGGGSGVAPNMNALQEFKVEVSGFSAEYGRLAGGIVNMALRSGTNDLHGDLFEYVRNNVIDARAFFDTEKLKLNRHQFGATLLGPVVLPKIYDGHSRTFFLFSWESYRQLIGRTSLAQTLTPLERAGDFTRSVNLTGQPATVLDPLGGNRPFPANRIPANRFHPTSVKLLDYFPLPNRASSGNNYITSANDEATWDSFMGKFDHRFDARNSVAFRYQVRDDFTGNPYGASGFGTFGNEIGKKASLLGLDYTHLFTSTFLMEARAGFSRVGRNESTVWEGRNMAQELGIPGTTTVPELLGFPKITVLGYEEIGSQDNKPLEFQLTDIQANTRFTWVRSRHAMKWGADFSRLRFNQPFANNARGIFAFQDRWTGHAIGDLLLGMLNNTSRTLGVTRTYMRASSMGGFFNDDWKVTPRLTLNLGIRYELNTAPLDRYDLMSNFLPGLGKIVLASRKNIPNLDQALARAGLGNLVTFASDVGLPRSLVFTDYTNVAPRFGFAWRAFGDKTVIRGGYGIFYTGFLLDPVRTHLMTGFPFALQETFSRLATRPDLVTLSNPFPNERAALGGVTNSNGYDTHAPTGYLQSYSFTLERDIGGGAVMEAGYVGSRGTHLLRRYDFNQPIRSLAAYQAGVTAVQQRPVKGINTINYISFGGNSAYNAGQIALRKRGRGGLFYRFNYAYGKSINDSSQFGGTVSAGGFEGAQNSQDLKAERGRADWDRGHTVTVAFSWQAPIGRGRRFLHSAHGIVQGLLGGWQLSGTGSFATGAPVTVTSADVDQNLGESQRPNRIGKGIPDGGTGRRGVDYPWFKLSDFEKSPRCESVRVCQPSPHGFLPFQFGNSGRNILDGPGYSYLNLAMMKHFRFAERRSFQFRLESFNIMNRPNFLIPEKQFNTLAGGLITGVAASGRGGPRVFQAALKLEF